MGNKKSHSMPAVETSTPVPLPPFTWAWDVIYAGAVQTWHSSAAVECGMDGYLYGCLRRDCDREAVCLQYLRASYSKSRRLLEVERFEKPTVSLTLPRSCEVVRLIGEGYELSPTVLAASGDYALLSLIHQNNVVIHTVFPLLDLHSQTLGPIHKTPQPNMMVINCSLTPDLSMTSVLFYSASRTERGFCYDLHLFCNTSAELVKTVSLNREVQPYISYDPRYKWSRLAVANYENRADSVRHELVILSLDSEKVIQRSSRSLPALLSASRFFLRHSKDGSLLILQKLTEDRFGLSAFSDIYIFHSDRLQLIKYVTAALPGLYHICKVNYEPVFSKCGSYMRVLDHKGCIDRQGVKVLVYQLPRQLNLMSQCRIAILQILQSAAQAETLPLPQLLRDYLQFKPFL